MTETSPPTPTVGAWRTWRIVQGTARVTDAPTRSGRTEDGFTFTPTGVRVSFARSALESTMTLRQVELIGHDDGRTSYTYRQEWTGEQFTADAPPWLQAAVAQLRTSIPEARAAS